MCKGNAYSARTIGKVIEKVIKTTNVQRVKFHREEICSKGTKVMRSKDVKERKE